MHNYGSVHVRQVQMLLKNTASKKDQAGSQWPCASRTPSLASTPKWPRQYAIARYAHCCVEFVASRAFPVVDHSASPLSLQTTNSATHGAWTKAPDPMEAGVLRSTTTTTFPRRLLDLTPM